MPQTPPQIQIVPYGKRKYLSPVFLHSSLGQTGNVSLFSKYRSIRGITNYSKNYRALYLYSGMLGAFLSKMMKSTYTPPDKSISTRQNFTSKTYEKSYFRKSLLSICTM